MNRSPIRPRLRPALLGLAVLLAAATSRAAAEETCTTASCHAALLKGKNVHAAAEACDSCHESTAAPHPQKGKQTFKLTQPAPALCQTCHDPIGTKSNVHPPAKEGMCLTCHNPHSSDQPKLLVQPLKELCQSCHPTPKEATHLHGPFSAGDCTACHAPHESSGPSLLVKQGDELCATCHTDVPEWLKKTEVHPALEGGCTTCHNPHGAPQPKLLAEAGADLCFQCHDPIAEKVHKSPVVHAAVKDGKQCVGCHSPHASDHRKLLLNDEKPVCLGCHAGILPKQATTIHGPIAKGLCTACHEPHGSQYAGLLGKEFPPNDHVPYTDTEYQLCFSCHNRDLVQYPDTSFATNFRNGDRNLHYLHVNKKQDGRSCKLCHEIHGSAGPSLIAESVPFGKWRLPLKFVKTENGGSCSPGCHRTQSYDRKNPDKKTPAASPSGGR
jgi:predicted CXXCH cytochrome family protein